MVERTLEHRELVRLQPLATGPATVNEQARTVELGIATEADVGGYVLTCRPEAVSSAAVVNVLLDHRNETSAIAGRLLSLRAEKGQLIGLAEFKDAPAAETGWQLASRGCPTSVRAQFSPDDIEPGRNGGPDLVRRWRLAEVSLVAIGADLTTTRSAGTAADMTTTNKEIIVNTSQTQTEAADLAAETVTATPGELRRAAQLERELKRLIDAAPHAAEAIRAAGDVGGLQAARTACIDAMADRQKLQPQTLHGRFDVGQDRRSVGLEDALLRRFKGDGSAVTALQILETVTGRRGSADELLRSAMATTDFAALFSAAGFKLLRERYDAAGTGARLIARRRQSGDLRNIHLLGLSEFPAMLKLLEGGEIKYGNFTDRGGFYRIEEFARGVNLTRRALLSDELDAFGEALSSYGRSTAALEDDLVIAALEASGTGAKSMEDGLALFHASHANTTTATGLSLPSLTEAAAKLREAREVGNGRRLNLAPRWLLVSAQYEVTAIQLTSEINATAASDVNPFAGGQLELMPLVDANLSGSHAYVLCDPASPAAAIEVCTGPAIADVQSQADFDTTSVKTRVLADRGLGVRDHRGVVRIPLS
jgi:hypothetical protein